MKRLLLLPALLSTVFAGAQTINELRYWVNDDPATLATAAVGPDADLNLSASWMLPNLPKDFNTVTYQFKDSDGRWSVPHTLPVLRNTGLADGYAYWIDDAIANATTGSLGPGQVVDLIADLPIGLPSGNHLFTIQFSSAQGSWSVPLTTEFSVVLEVPELPGVTDLLLFPNPITQQLSLRLSTEEARTLDLQVVDLRGAVVADLSTWSVSSTATRNWDLSTLAPGNYLLRFTGDDGVAAIPFVKE
ncbi:MAG: T9SS type A sorting domain-containing protein [Flavobacteriales bacterium]|nr:T9SS type A sorting domain-containing protein [Flavobacteriales bacterium]